MAEEDWKWFRASLRFMGEELPVDEISDWLGVKADSLGRKGRHIRGNPRYGLYSTNIWTWRAVEGKSQDFETQILPVLNLLEAKTAELARIMAFSGVKAELILGFASGNGQGNGSISSQTLSRIGALGLDIKLDLYPPGEIPERKRRARLD